jgi:hypothetical protein
MGIMAIYTTLCIFFGRVLILQVLGKTFYLREIPGPPGQFQVTDQTALAGIHSRHSFKITIMNLPVTMADLAGNREMAAFLPIVVLCLMAPFTLIGSLIQRLQVHLLLKVGSPEVSVLTKRIRNQQ